MYGQPTNDVAIYTTLGDRGSELKKHLDSYDATKDYRELEWVATPPPVATTTNRWTLDAKLFLDIELLSRSLAGIDNTFDETKVTIYGNSARPPTDAAERQKYDQWWAENQRLRARANNNLALKRIARKSQHQLGFFLEGMARRGEFERLGVLTNAIAVKIRDPETRDQLLRGVEAAAKKPWRAAPK